MRTLMTSLRPRSGQAIATTILLLLAAGACTPNVPQPTGPAADYDNLKRDFKNCRFERVLSLSDTLAKANPPNAFSSKALVARAVTYAGLMEGAKLTGESYQTGANVTKNPRFRAEYNRLSTDNFHMAAEAGMGLAEAVRQLTENDLASGSLYLEVPYPTPEGPEQVPQLIRAQEGGWIEPDQQVAASAAAMRKGMDDVLAAVVSGDRAKAKTELTSGPVKLNAADFMLFAANQIKVAASLYDRKHLRDPQRFELLTKQVTAAIDAGLAQLKQNPNADLEKQFKKLEDQMKTAVKNG
jgi:hypothetical protein